MSRRRGWLIVLLAAGFFLVNRCADGGAMAARYQTCTGLGIEWLQDDRTPPTDRGARSAWGW